MVELLAPAKNYEYGVAAINAGADAVYIGGPKFGARYGATNSLEDIAALVSYAHLFGVKVFVTLNTVLFDNELESARQIAMSLSAIGVDALIVQDMSYLMFGLDVPLHASTQAAALTPEKVLFYEQAGFERVILERAMSLDDICAIRKATNVELEMFVHGAICVSMSGQCYMGQAVAGRSGNRGVCSQPCRSVYSLTNEKGEILIKNKHLLSLQDLNLSDYIPQLIECGISSFKIEGRLKDISYLKNSVAHYRREIDRAGAIRSSVGESVLPFTAIPIKTFSRRFTPYFIEGAASGKLASFHTAKALGEEIGRVISVSRDAFTVESSCTFNGGDGICFIDTKGNFGGTNINRSHSSNGVVTLYPNVMDGIVKGAMIYRNSDKRYIDEVTSAKVLRQIKATIELVFGEQLHLRATDATGLSVEMIHYETLDIANNPQKASENFKLQFAKSGDTIFEVTDVLINGEVRFMAVSQINALRRELLDRLKAKRLAEYRRNEPLKVCYPKPYCERLDYRGNVTNYLAREFYERCGFSTIEDGVELRDNIDGVALMTTRYCIRKEIGECLKEGGAHGKLFLEEEQARFELIFDCKECRMKILKKSLKK